MRQSSARLRLFVSPKFLLVSLFALVCVISVMLYQVYSAERIIRYYLPLVEASTAFQREATSAHLWFEEILSGDRHEDITEVWRHLDEAQRYVSAMLDGGTAQSGEYLPLRNPQLRQLLSRIQASLHQFRRIAEQRYDNWEASLPGSRIDQTFDAVFDSFVNDATTVSLMLQDRVSAAHRDYQRLSYLLIALVAVFWGVATVKLGQLYGQREQALHTLTAAHTQIQEQNTALEYMAHFDALSELPNRVLAFDRLNQALAHARRSDGWVALVFIDIDNFKLINDSLGHHLGDELIKAFTTRVKKVIRAADTLARIGGDEFMLILPGQHNRDEAIRVASRIVGQVREKVAENLILGGHEVYVTCSAGIALYPRDGDDCESLMRNADAAMYQVKRRGRNHFLFYDKGMSTAVPGRVQLQTELRSAIKAEEFCLHYQPVVSLAQNRIVGLEALIRWRHPRFGLIAPEQFIQLAEDTGLIVEIGAWVFAEAGRQMRAWRDGGIAPEYIAVNLSAIQFRHHGVMELLGGLVRDGSLEPETIELEVTETALMSQSEESLAHLRQLKQLGFRLSIDDFGTGYSSMAYLKHFPVDTLKVDASFIADVGLDHASDAIVKGMIDLAHNLGLTTVAEGVETQGQYERLRAMGCQRGQGHLFAEASDAERMGAKLATNPQVSLLKLMCFS